MEIWKFFEKIISSNNESAYRTSFLLSHENLANDQSLIWVETKISFLSITNPCKQNLHRLYSKFNILYITE